MRNNTLLYSVVIGIVFEDLPSIHRANLSAGEAVIHDPPVRREPLRTRNLNQSRIVETESEPDEPNVNPQPSTSRAKMSSVQTPDHLVKLGTPTLAPRISLKSSRSLNTDGAHLTGTSCSSSRISRGSGSMNKTKNEVSFFAGRDDPSKPDEVFFDHRQSNCMFLPREQGQCGSCYAFTTIAIAKWLHCRKTGMNGCHGGNVYKAANFLHHFGVELRSDYLYMDKEGHCPYGDNTDPQTMGSIRVDIEMAVAVPLRRLEDYIRYAPMYISVSIKNGLPEYGGGILGGEGCEPSGTHAVVLVGHGRQDGIEYWLIRDSAGPDWGESGHFKLTKESDCIHERYGALFGTYEGGQFKDRIEENPRHDPSILKKLQDKVN